MPVEKERRLEAYKARLGIVNSIILALIGLIVSFILAANSKNQEAEAKRIEYRVQFYKSVANDVNTLYGFVCRVGNFYFIAPSDAGTIKRKLDVAFTVNLPFMSSETYGYYQAFTGTFVQYSQEEGKHFKFRLDQRIYSKDYVSQRTEFMHRGGKAGDAPPEVSDPELREWFAIGNENPPGLDEVKPASGDEVKKAYVDLLYGFSKDSGFGSEKIGLTKLYSPIRKVGKGPPNNCRRDMWVK
jgi:hypothetical protein